MRRLGLIVGGIQLTGLALASLPRRPRLNALGVGLIAPGAGYLYTRRPGRALGTAVAVPASLTLFFASGNHVVAPAVWLGSALDAGSGARSDRLSESARVAVPIAVASIYVVEWRRRRRLLDQARARGAQLNTYLATVTPPMRGAEAPPVTVGEELNEAELAMMRRIVDIALQDAKDWSNYEVIDQFRESAVRYTMTGYMRAIQTLQYARMPAFRGYLSESQRRLISKHQQPLVWKYWFWENLWGNLEFNADPVRKQNIMLTGFLAASIGAYERITGDLQFSRPDALTFVVSSRKSYTYSFTSIMESLARDFEQSPFGLVACEPNWIYALCNTNGAAGAYLHSQVHGSDLFDRIGPAYLRGFREEFLAPDGTTRLYLSTRTGVSGPTASAASDAAYQRAFAPDLADRSWALTRKAFTLDDDGKYRTGLAKKRGVFDPGNYSRSLAYAYGTLASHMREAGEDELANAALDELQEQMEVYVDERGWLSVDGASGFAHSEIATAMFGRRGTWLNLMRTGMPDHWARGPLLDHVPYPEVLVTRAVSNDGTDLDVVLRPGTGPGVRTLRLTQLMPGASYLVTGATSPTIRADGAGTSDVDVDIIGRTELRVRPAL